MTAAVTCADVHACTQINKHIEEKKRDAPGEADFKEAEMLLSQGNPYRALPLMRRAAEAGHAEAQSSVGDFYMDVPSGPSYEKAAEFYGSAADQGCASAQYSLGRLYHQGQQLP